MDTGQGKPVYALMGEFSAGKSTLANLLIGAGVSPVQVTATQLPPVWFRHGTGNPVVVGLDGTEREIGVDALDGVPVDTTSYVRVFVPSDILEVMDIIDMPGNSDPNMPAEVWRRALHHATGVIWCSHATQAWRQSEAAVWEEMPEALRARSMLLLTRFDKIKGEIDRARLLKRVRAEAGDQFHAILPVSLLAAAEAGDDRGRWEASGAEAFLQELLDLAMGAAGAPPEEEPPAPERDVVAVMPRRVEVSKRDSGERRAAERPGG